MGPPGLTPHIYSHLQFKGDRYFRREPRARKLAGGAGGRHAGTPEIRRKKPISDRFSGRLFRPHPESLPELAFESLPYPEPDRRIAAVDWSRRCLFFPLEGIHAARKSISTRHLFTGRARSCA